jgi:hypothetical protein
MAPPAHGNDAVGGDTHALDVRAWPHVGLRNARETGLISRYVRCAIEPSSIAADFLPAR